jgi:putative hydrolase of the HAD superfamily
LPALIFDLDDTLYPERGYVLSGFASVARWIEAQAELDAGRTCAELAELFDGGAKRDAFDRWVSARRLPEAISVESMVGVYRDHDPLIELDPRTRILLTDLKRRHKLGLVTDGRADVQRRKIEALGVAELLDEIVVTAELGVGFSKPHPAAYRAVLGRLGVDAADAVYVADNPVKDFIGARSVGVRSVRLRRPDGIYAELEPASSEYAPDLEITDLQHLTVTLATLSAAAETKLERSPLVKERL